LQEDENKRYIIQDSVLIKTKESATLSAIVVRKKGVTTQQPAALFFNICTDFSLNVAKRAAAHGYVGVTAETRRKRFSRDEIVPYEHEAKDTYDVIDWIIVDRPSSWEGEVRLSSLSGTNYPKSTWFFEHQRRVAGRLLETAGKMRLIAKSSR
jgi:hypothetical protein